MLEKKVTYDHTITEDGSIRVRQITRIFEDDIELSKSYHRHVVSPGDSSHNQDERTIKLIKTIHTLDVITDFKIKCEEMINAK